MTEPAQPTAVEIDRIDHVVLTVRDVDATCAFYARVLGMRAVTFAGGRKALAFGRRTISLQVMRLGWNPRISTPERVGSEFRKREAEMAPVDKPAPKQEPAAATEPAPIPHTQEPSTPPQSNAAPVPPSTQR